MKNIIWVYIAIVVAVLGGLVWLMNRPTPPNVLDSFAQCISDTGTKYYGAFWCPNCKNQNAMFGSAKAYLPYIECSTPDGKSQTKECTEAGVQAYPTWVFPDGEKETGTLSLPYLSERTACQLPQ
ncbi:MAG: hypothetical protein WD874_02140 [Parcubacteria group bacterium]